MKKADEHAKTPPSAEDRLKLFQWLGPVGFLIEWIILRLESKAAKASQEELVDDTALEDAEEQFPGLVAELRALREKNRRLGWFVEGQFKTFILFTTGRELDQALRGLLTSLRRFPQIDDNLDPAEVARGLKDYARGIEGNGITVAAAIVRRLIRVEFLIAALAVLPFLAAIWQVVETRAQLDEQRRQFRASEMNYLRRAVRNPTLPATVRASALEDFLSQVFETWTNPDTTPTDVSMRILDEYSAYYLDRPPDLNASRKYHVSLNAAQLGDVISHGHGSRHWGFDLSRADLSNSTLSFTGHTINAIHTDARGAKLSLWAEVIDFRRADLRDSEITGEGWKYIDLQGADIRGAKLRLRAPGEGRLILDAETLVDKSTQLPSDLPAGFPKICESDAECGERKCGPAYNCWDRSEPCATLKQCESDVKIPTEITIGKLAPDELFIYVEDEP